MLVCCAERADAGCCGDVHFHPGHCHEDTIIYVANTLVEYVTSSVLHIMFHTNLKSSNDLATAVSTIISSAQRECLSLLRKLYILQLQ